MTTGMPELGSKISLISKADIRYEGRLFTVDPQECTIALASVRSFGTEDRETQYQVPSQNQVYDYILFRGSDIKDIRVMSSMTPQPLNDPAIMQLSVPPTLTGQTYQTHPVLGHFAGSYGSMGSASSASNVGPFNTQRETRNTNNTRPPSVLDLFSGSRSATPANLGPRRSQTNEQGVQTAGASQNGRTRPSRPPQQPPNQTYQRNFGDRRDSRGANQQTRGQGRPQLNFQHQNSHSNQPQGFQGYRNQASNYRQSHQGYQNYFHDNTRRNWVNQGMSRPNRSRPNPTVSRTSNTTGTRSKNTLKFENDYDFEQANTEFEELKNKLSNVKLDDAGDKKEDSGNETAACDADTEQEEDHEIYYDKSKSFFDKISCDAVERANGKSQKMDWKVQRKLNSETFGVASPRRRSFKNNRGYHRGPGYRNGYRTNYRHPQQADKNQQSSSGPSDRNDAQKTEEKEPEKPEEKKIVESDKDPAVSVDPEVEVFPGCSQVAGKDESIPEPTMAVK